MLSRTYVSVMKMMFDDLLCMCSGKIYGESVEKFGISAKSPEILPLHAFSKVFECMNYHVPSHMLCCTHIDAPL
jgi:hypothetical protein